MKGALVEFMQAFGASLPNLIVFQFNPETLRHSVSQPQAPENTGGNPLAVQGVPGETFSFTLALDASDVIANGPGPAAIEAEANGVYARLAALEMLMFPVPSDALPGGGGDSRATPASQLPAVLFVWGAGRVVPVRVSGLTITEKLFDDKLNPTHAEVQIELKVLTPSELAAVSGPLKQLAQGAYHYTQDKRKALALLALGNMASFDLPPIPGG